MEFGGKLIKGKILRLYKGLILDVCLDNNEEVPVFCPEGEIDKKFYASGTEIWVIRNRDVKRKLRYEAVLIKQGGAMVLVNPLYYKDVFLESYDKGKLTDFASCLLLREIPDDDENFRHIDLEFVDENKKKLFVKIVGVYNKQEQFIVFPSSLTFFDFATFEKMRQLRAQGHRTAFVFVVPRMDCLEAKFTWNINPIAAAKIFEEAKNGLEFFCYGCKIDKTGVKLADRMKINY